MVAGSIMQDNLEPLLTTIATRLIMERGTIKGPRRSTPHPWSRPPNKALHLVEHLAGRGKLPDPVKEELGFGPEYQPKK